MYNVIVMVQLNFTLWLSASTVFIQKIIAIKMCPLIVTLVFNCIVHTDLSTEALDN